MKKKILTGAAIALGIILVLFLGFCIYMETHFTCTTAETIYDHPEQYLKEEPEIAFSAQDEAMLSALFQTLEITQALDAARESENGFYEFPAEDARALLSPYLREDDQYPSIYVWDAEQISVDFVRHDGANITYSASFDGQYREKLVTFYGKDILGKYGVERMYQNVNGTIAKIKEKRLWFYWWNEFFA